MENKLIKNVSVVFYTVKISEELVVSSSDFRRGELGSVQISREGEEAFKYERKETAQKVALYTNGQIIKHTRTEVITETTEQIRAEESK